MARSKEFDLTETLDKAVMLFWQQGYEKTSMQNLVDAMGIHRRSIYDTYGDKHKLFIKALARYETIATELYAEAQNSQTLIKEKLAAILLAGYHHSEQYPQGCLLINSATELALIDDEVANQVHAMFERSKRSFEQLLVVGKENQEFSSDLDSKKYAEFLHNTLIGLRVLGKNKTLQVEAENIIEITLSTLR